MKREYDTGTSKDVTVFIGKEIEHTPAYGLTTLFIVGVLPIEEIEGYLSKLDYPDIEHIFFGANHSFDLNNARREWEEMITHFLDKGYLCSLDISLSQVEIFNDYGFNEYDNFIPQIRVPVPYIKLWNYNTMIKIDDSDFNHSNPGVWTHSLHKLMDRECFTSWKDYSLDKVVK